MCVALRATNCSTPHCDQACLRSFMTRSTLARDTYTRISRYDLFSFPALHQRSNVRFEIDSRDIASFFETRFDMQFTICL